MDDLVCVHVAACANELYHEEAGFWFCETAAATKHVHEGAVMAELEGHVYIFVVLETVLEPNDVWVVESAVNLDFRVELYRKEI